MRKHLLLIFLITFFSANLFAQESTLFLKSGTITLSYDIEIDRSNNINYHFVCFSKIPSNKEKENIRDIGIDFLEYIPNRAYVVSIPKTSILLLYLILVFLLSLLLSLIIKLILSCRIIIFLFGLWITTSYLLKYYYIKMQIYLVFRNLLK